MIINITIWKTVNQVLNCEVWTFRAAVQVKEGATGPQQSEGHSPEGAGAPPLSLLPAPEHLGRPWGNPGHRRHFHCSRRQREACTGSTVAGSHSLSCLGLSARLADRWSVRIRRLPSFVVGSADLILQLHLPLSPAFISSFSTFLHHEPAFSSLSFCLHTPPLLLMASKHFPLFASLSHHTAPQPRLVVVQFSIPPATDGNFLYAFGNISCIYTLPPTF